MKRLAIITTHPIQYNAPLFALLAQREKIHLKVFYTWGSQVLENKFDPGFGKKVDWDIPLLEGYEFEFVANISAQPGSHHFKGIDNPGLLISIEQWGADIVLIYGWAFKSHLRAMRYFHGKIPVLFRGDSTLLNEQQGLRKLVRRIFLKRVYGYVDYALYVGTENRAYFESFGLRSEQLRWAPHAIDNDRFTGTGNTFDQAAKEWKASLGIKEGELTILYAGKLEAIKNPGFIIELGMKLTDMPVKLVIVGNGPLEEELKQDVGNHQQFIFIDFQNQLIMPVVYRLGDVFILSSKSETWGLSVNEAMVSGVAIMLSSNVGSAVDLVTEGENGMVFDLKDMDKCTGFINDLVNTPLLLNKMKLASREKIKNFSFSNIATTIEQLCNDLNN